MNILRGRTFGPMLRVFYGEPGVGKSSIACKVELGCRNVLALDYENGLGHIGPDRVVGATTWDASLKLIREACESKGDWDTVVIDTVDALEEQAKREVLKGTKCSTIEEIGFQAGVYATAAKWRELLFVLQVAKTKGRSVHLVGHVTTITNKDPTMPKDYAKRIASLTKHSWGATHQAADAVLFCDYERGMSDGRAVMTGERLLKTVAGTGYDAKHRPNIKAVLPLSWLAYEKEQKRYERAASEIRDRISSLAPQMTPEQARFLRDAGDDVEKLVRIEVKLEEKTETKNGVESPPAPAPAAGPPGPLASLSGPPVTPGGAV